MGDANGRPGSGDIPLGEIRHIFGGQGAQYGPDIIGISAIFSTPPEQGFCTTHIFDDFGGNRCLTNPIHL